MFKPNFKVLEALGSYHEELVLGLAELRLLADRCSDPAVSIRKQVTILFNISQFTLIHFLVAGNAIFRQPT